MSTPTPILVQHRELLIRELQQAEEYGDIYLARQIADSLCHIEDLLLERGVRWWSDEDQQLRE